MALTVTHANTLIHDSGTGENRLWVGGINFSGTTAVGGDVIPISTVTQGKLSVARIIKPFGLANDGTLFLHAHYSLANGVWTVKFFAVDDPSFAIVAIADATALTNVVSNVEILGY